MHHLRWINSITLLVLWGCAQAVKVSPLPYYNTPDFTPQFLLPNSAGKKISHHIGPFQVLNQHGNYMGLEKLKGKIHIANFFFTSCSSICPSMMRHLKKAVEAYSSDSMTIFMSFSVTPWIDSVPRLRQYAKVNQFDSPYWHLCTGETKAIYQLARRSYFAEEALGYTKDSTDFLHTEHVLLVDPALRIRGIYNASLPLDIEQLISDISTLRKEIDQEKKYSSK